MKQLFKYLKGIGRVTKRIDPFVATIDTLIGGCYDSAMSKPNIEQLEANITTLLEAYRKLKEESKRLSIQVESLTVEKQSFSKEKEFIKEKLARLSELEAVNKNNENDRIQVQEKVTQLLEKLDKFDLT